MNIPPSFAVFRWDYPSFLEPPSPGGWPTFHLSKLKERHKFVVFLPDNWRPLDEKWFEHLEQSFAFHDVVETYDRVQVSRPNEIPLEMSKRGFLSEFPEFEFHEC